MDVGEVRHAQTIEVAWPARKNDGVLLNLEVVRSVYPGQGNDERRADAEDTDVLDELPAVEVRWHRRLQSLPLCQPPAPGADPASHGGGYQAHE